MRKIFFTIILLFFVMIPSVGNASTLFFLPQNTEYQESDTFIQILHIDTGNQEINTIESKINFDQNALETIDIITGDSVIKLW